MAYLNLKLPENVVTVFLPPMTTTAQVLDVPASTRVTRAGNVRVTRAGNVRATHYQMTNYPEIVGMKINNTVQTIPIGEA